MVFLNLSEKDLIKNESFYKVLKEVAVEKKADLINFSFQYVIEWFLTVLEMSRMSWN